MPYGECFGNQCRLDPICKTFADCRKFDLITRIALGEDRPPTPNERDELAYIEQWMAKKNRRIIARKARIAAVTWPIVAIHGKIQAVYGQILTRAGNGD